MSVGKPFVLSEGLLPVPKKLVTWILRGELVDMAQILHDNLEAQRGSSSTPLYSVSSGSNSARNRLVGGRVLAS